MSARILVVEDEALIAEDIDHVLRRLGYEVAGVVESGEEALRTVANTDVDLALMDIVLRGPLDGIRAAKAMRERWGTPVVFLTSHSDDATLRRARSAVPHGYLLKPFSERDLRTTVEIVLARVQLERELAVKEQWFTDTMASLGEAVITTDRDDIVTYLNPVAERLTGWTCEAARGRPLAEVLVLEAIPALLATGTAGRSTSAPRIVQALPQMRVLSADGQARLVDDTRTTIVGGRGETLGSVVVARDVTETRRLERRIACSARVASLVSLGTGVAHEINNPLTGVVMRLEFAQEAATELRGIAQRLCTVSTVPEGETLDAAHQELTDIAESIDVALEGAGRVVRIVTALRDLARSGTAGDHGADLDVVADRAAAACREATGADIEVHHGELVLAAGDEHELVEVVGSLLSNAVEAVARGNTGTLIEVSIALDRAGNVTLCVADRGAGIPAADIPRVFDPFFTTKRLGDSLGFGLARAQRTVAAYEGDITIEQRPGGGTLVTLTLPCTAHDGDVGGLEG